MDWNDLLNKAQGAGSAEIDAVKAALPITYVLERAGYPVMEYDGTSAHTLCPFHADSDPSFDVFGEALERWGCFPCGKGGDVLDLIGALFSPADFGAKMDMARALIEEKNASGWTGPTTGVKKEFDWNAARALVEQTTAGDPIQAVQDFLDAKVSKGSVAFGEINTGWLVKEFRLGQNGVEIVIPYFDREGGIVSYKHRTADTKALSPAGSGQFDDIFYGEWRDDGESPVVLCEGESDTWAAAAALGSQFSVLGLPLGAGAHPKQAARLAGRKVVVAFDGDEAGRAASLKWYAALTASVVNADVWLAPVPDDTDLASLSFSHIKDVIRRARAVPEVPTGLNVTAAGYQRPGKETNTPLSNWIFVPTRELLGDRGSAYEGRVMPNDSQSVLASHDLRSKASIVNWSSKNGGSWYGSDRDAQLLLGILQAQGPFLPPGRMSTEAGLHDGHFIWPGNRIGADYWVYVPPATDVHLDERMFIKGGEAWSPEQVTILRELHDHRVTDPILAWMALAPLRSLLREFPILAVTGSSGSGKTTLVETLVKHFTGTLITNNLTATTRHSVFAFIGATNAFPVWFDEYRPGARKDAIETLNQLLRDAYTGQASSKGGMGEQWAEVTSVATHAPIIVSGEDAFAETSHTERMILVSLPVDGKNPAALTRIKGWGEHSFAHAYLTWLHVGLQDGSLPIIQNFEAGPEDLPARQRLNLGALALGWALLKQFCFQFGGIELGDPDFSLVEEEGREASLHNPILDAIMWALDEEGGEVAVHCDGEMLYVRPENLIAMAEKVGFTLPGGPKAITSYLRTNYGAEPGTYTIYGRTRKGLAMPASCLTS